MKKELMKGKSCRIELTTYLSADIINLNMGVRNMKKKISAFYKKHIIVFLVLICIFFYSLLVGICLAVSFFAGGIEEVKTTLFELAFWWGLIAAGIFVAIVIMIKK